MTTHIAHTSAIARAVAEAIHSSRDAAVNTSAVELTNVKLTRIHDVINKNIQFLQNFQATGIHDVENKNIQFLQNFQATGIHDVENKNIQFLQNFQASQGKTINGAGNPTNSSDEEYFSNSKASLQQVAAADTAATPLSPQLKSTVDAMGSSINTITNLTTRITADSPGSSQADNVGELGYQLNDLATTITFAVSHPANLINNIPLTAAILMVTVDMTTVMGIYVNYAQQQLQQMNKMQVLVQDMVNAAIQLSAQLQKIMNVLIQQAIQNNQNNSNNNTTTPNDSYVTNSQGQAAAYAADNKYGPPPLNGVIPQGNASWSNVGLGSAMGGYCMTQAGVAYVDLPDDVDLNSPGALDAALNGAGAPNYNTSANQMWSNGSAQTGANMCFVVTQSGSGVNIPGSLSLPAALFNMIPPSYLSTQAVSSSMAGNTVATGSNGKDNSLVEPMTGYPNPSNAQVGYLNMGMLSAICQNVLTLASTYLPTGGYGSQFDTAFGPSSTGQISIKTMASMMQSISQIPSNLTPTISSFQQQVESIVQAVTQMFQLVNQIIPNLSMK